MVAEANASPVALRWRAFRLPLVRPVGTAVGVVGERRGVVLELRDPAGHIGLGEAAPYPGMSAETVEDLLDLLAEGAPRLLDPSIDLTSLPSTLACAIDTAMLDLAGRQSGVAVASLIANDAASSVEVNAVIGDQDGVAVRARAQEAAHQGYGTLKLKVGVEEPMVDIARIAAARAGAPDARLRLDANGAWTVEVARAMLAATAQQRVELIEQPVAAGQIEQLTTLRGTSGVLTAADESMLVAPVEVIQRGAADVIVLKPMLLGGLRIALALSREAAKVGLPAIITSTFESSIGTAAALHLAAAAPARGLAHGLSTATHLARDIVAAPLVPAGGRLLVGAPGLGVELDEAALEEVAESAWAEVAA